MRRKYSEKRAGKFKMAVRQSWCVYCGAPANTADHFVPVSVVAVLSSLGRVQGKFRIPCCRECNEMANSKIFPSIGAKRRYLQKQIRRKYLCVLSMPNWDESETSELGHSLCTFVQGGVAQREYIRSRLEWRNSYNVEPAKLAAIRFRLIAMRGFSGHDRDDG